MPHLHVVEVQADVNGAHELEQVLVRPPEYDEDADEGNLGYPEGQPKDPRL